MTQQLEVETPLGQFVLAAHDGGLTHCQHKGSANLPAAGRTSSEAALDHLQRGHDALGAYFAGEKDPWDTLRLAPEGTPFRQQVWAALRRIPYGTTCSYGELAKAVGSPRAARAIGQANHFNPLGIIVPCHRVVAADGTIGGYAGGLERKRWLLRHEGALAADESNEQPSLF